MCVRYLGFVLLAWLPCLIQAQNIELSCHSPVLSSGYFVPEQQEYTNGTTLTYACDTGHKPVVEGWWATSTCQNGNWSHTPQCIDENACFPPTIPNGKYTKSPNGWYEEKDKITVTCSDGYKLKPRSSPTVCTNREWLPEPVCEKMPNACTEPPKIPHAVVINQTPQEVYAAKSILHYACEDGYEGTDLQSTCRAGTWTPRPSCIAAAGCVIHNPAQFSLQQTSAIHLTEGETNYFPCTRKNYHKLLHCSNRQIKTSTSCCYYQDISNGHCGRDSLSHPFQ